MSGHAGIVFLGFPFSIGRVLADSSGPETRLELHHGLRPTVRWLREAGLRIGALALARPSSENAAQEIAAAGAGDLFESALVLNVADPGALRLRIDALGVPPEACVVVSVESAIRRAAASAGLSTSPHPVLAPAVLRGERLCYAALSSPEPGRIADLLKQPHLPLVPISSGSGPDATLLVLTTLEHLAAAQSSGWSTRMVGDASVVRNANLSRLYPGEMTPDEEQSLRRSIADKGLEVLDDSRTDWLLATPDDRHLDLEPPKPSHGHTIALFPSRSRLSALSNDTLEPMEAAAPAREALDLITGECIRTFSERWFKPPIVSRYVEHPDNARAVQGMAEAMRGILGFGNVATPALLSGSGLLNVVGRLQGTDLAQEIVVLGAHLDSIAMASRGGTPPHGPAPGADDDASGVAAVLSCAHVLVHAGLRPRRTIEFVLFNAEEDGMIGSYSYVNELKGRDLAGTARLRAMIQVDMIGRESQTKPGYFEIHGVGPEDFSFYGENLVTQTDAIVRVLKRAHQSIGSGLRPETYPRENCGTSPGAYRSDHRNFLDAGWPAVLVTEDFFDELVCNGKDNGNPDYHSPNDTHIDFEYAAEISKVITAAIWMIANA